MRRVLLVLAAVSLSCSSRTGRPPAAPDGAAPRLTLTVYPPIRLTAGDVTLTARYGPDEPPDSYCPAVRWEYGDGESSSWQATCGPDRSTSWQVRHRYKATGQFLPEFRLWDGPRQVGFARAVVLVGAP